MRCTVTFMNQSTPTTTITSYLWKFGDGVTSTITNPVHSYTSTGAYTVILTGFTASQQAIVTKTNYLTVTSNAASATLITTTISYTHDPLSRLTCAVYSGVYTYTFAYAYDQVGNCTA